MPITNRVSELFAMFECKTKLSASSFCLVLWLIVQTLAVNETGRACLAEDPDLYVVVLGNAQDAGFPQSNCKKKCCRDAWSDPDKRRYATAIAVVDKSSRTKTLFECTPHFPNQIHLLDKLENGEVANYQLNGIYLTHAHIGHYAGLIHLGREVEGAKGVPVHVMPRMREFLIGNGPWSQLVELKNISLRRLTADVEQQNGRIKVTPILVPHRDEFSETVGYRISSSNRSLLFLPDIDKWEKWKTRIEEQISQVDYALLDGTFFDGNELPGRDMSRIPHPFVIESMKRFKTLKQSEKKKIHFIHLNHTNPLLQPDSKARKLLEGAGYRIAKQGQKIPL